MDWKSASEVVTGMVLNNKINPQSVNPETLMPPYDLVVAMKREGKDMTDLVDKVGLSCLQTADMASKTVENKLPADWVELLERSASRAQAAEIFAKEAKRLEKGEEANIAKLTQAMEKVATDKLRFVSMSEVTDGDMTWRRTFFPPLDNHIGNPDPDKGRGFPDASLIIVGAPPGCITGDADIVVNRAGKSFHLTLEGLEAKFNHREHCGGRMWDDAIPTRTQCTVDNHSVMLGNIAAVTMTGIKPCYKLTTDYGTISGTGDHPFLRPDGSYTEMLQLHPGELVCVNVGKSHNGRYKPYYTMREGLRYHPFAGKKTSNRYAVPVHRLVAEAEMNDITVEELIERCREGSVEGLKFIDPSQLVVHHIDCNSKNNAPENLQVMTITEHKLLHSNLTKNNYRERIEYAHVLKIEYVGEQKTYDVAMESEPHNFIVNKFVVHNTGKTSLLVKILGNAAKAGKLCALFTLEMTNEQITRRMIDSVGLDEEERKNILLCDEQADAEEVYTYGCQLASLHPDLYFIGVDFADLMVSGDEDDAKVGKIYRTMAKLAKVTRVPVILLSQLNREYVGGIPRIHNLRYSGLAEAMGALILLLYNPKQIWANMGTDNRLPIFDGRGYIIVGKSRFGFLDGGVGAISCSWDGLRSWGEDDYGYISLG